MDAEGLRLQRAALEDPTVCTRELVKEMIAGVHNLDGNAARFTEQTCIKKLVEGDISLAQIFGYLTNPPEAVCQAAVWVNPNKIAFIPHQSKEVRNLAIQRSPESLQFIGEQTDLVEEVVQAWIKKATSPGDWSSKSRLTEMAKYINNKTLPCWTEILRLNPLSIIHAAQTEQQCLDALKGNVSLDYIREENRTYQVCLEAVRVDQGNIRHVPFYHQSEEICLLTFKDKDHKPELEHVAQEKQTPKIVLQAVKCYRGNLPYVRRDLLTEEVVWAADGNIYEGLLLKMKVFPDFLRRYVAKWPTSLTSLLLDVSPALRFELSLIALATGQLHFDLLQHYRYLFTDEQYIQCKQVSKEAVARIEAEKVKARLLERDKK